MWSVSSKYLTITRHFHQWVDRIDGKFFHIPKLQEKLPHQRLRQQVSTTSFQPQACCQPFVADRKLSVRELLNVFR
jgi:hypothetical protein